MKVRCVTSLVVIVCLLSTSAVVLGKKGDKNFKEGLAYEAAQQWDRAAQEFTLAVAADPGNMDYQLHYRRALFYASQGSMQQGKALAEKGNYDAAFNSFRQAYAYDPVNQLAISEMKRMVELREETALSQAISESLRPVDYRVSANERPGNREGGQTRGALKLPEQLRVISYKGDLETLIASLAEQINLNVIFDTISFNQPRTIRINLRDVTTVKALDFIFQKEGLFFQKLDRHTIMVADQTRRAQYQQLVLRTFYLANIEPQEAQRFVQAMIPPSMGRPVAIVTPEKSTNSITVRDTAENVRLIGELLKNIDKERAEVVMDVQIYEVSASDLLRIGNQLGTESTLANLGGASSLSTILGSRQVAQQVFTAPTALGAALVFPASTISLLQKKGRTRVLASTQMHAFDGEKSEVHIGQRVPVQTAQLITNTTNTNGTGSLGSTGYPVINYEPTGLTLEFTPQVYPNLDVQVKMSIKSNDVSSANSLTPSFTERSLSGTARIQNNQTMMIASVSQDQQSQTRAGLPLVGLVPILGRLFSAPSNDGKRTDIVVAVTPRVLRAPAITRGDEEPLKSGTAIAPTTESLAVMLTEAESEDQLAIVKPRPPQESKVSDEQESTEYVPGPKSATSGVSPTMPVMPNRILTSITPDKRLPLTREAGVRIEPGVERSGTPGKMLEKKQSP